MANQRDPARRSRTPKSPARHGNKHWNDGRTGNRRCEETGFRTEMRDWNEENSIPAKAETVLGFLAKIILSILNPLVEAMIE